MVGAKCDDVAKEILTSVATWLDSVPLRNDPVTATGNLTVLRSESGCLLSASPSLSSHCALAENLPLRGDWVCLVLGTGPSVSVGCHIDLGLEWLFSVNRLYHTTWLQLPGVVGLVMDVLLL